MVGRRAADCQKKTKIDAIMAGKRQAIGSDIRLFVYNIYIYTELVGLTRV